MQLPLISRFFSFLIHVCIFVLGSELTFATSIDGAAGREREIAKFGNIFDRILTCDGGTERSDQHCPWRNDSLGVRDGGLHTFLFVGLDVGGE